MRLAGFMLTALLVLAAPAESQTRIPRCYARDIPVLSLFEGRDGYLWLGTTDGVLRFDGELERFWPQQGLPPGPVRSIREGPGGGLYFATETGAGLRKGERFWRLPPGSGLLEGRVRVISPGPEGSLFFGYEHEVVRLQAGGRAERISLGLPPGQESVVQSLLWARDGTLYAGTVGRGAIAVRRGVPSPVPAEKGFRPRIIRAIHETRDGRLYFGTRQGLAVLRDGVLRRPREMLAEVYALQEGRDGALHVATGEGLWIGGSLLSTREGLSHNLVNSVLETRSGDVYIGTDRGFCVYQRGVIQSWTRSHGLPDGSVNAIMSDAGGRIFAGMDRGLAVLEKGTWKSLERGNGRPSGEILALQLDARGVLHLGMGEPGGGAYFRDGGRFREIPLPHPKTPDRVYKVYAAHRTRDGSLYLGGTGGLFRVRDGAASRLYGEDAVLAIDSSADGALWLGTWERGLVRYKDGRFQEWNRWSGLGADRVETVTAGRDGRIYAGTLRGLSIFHRGGFRHLGRSEGLSQGDIQCVLEDSGGRAFVHMEHGIAILDPGGPAVLRELSPEDGLASSPGSWKACFRDGEGRLWFGGAGGITVYDPRRELPRTAPIPRLLGWQLFEEALPLPGPGETPRLSGRENYYLTFDFLGIDLATPRDVRYRYRLAGLEADWTQSAGRRVRYTNLGPGDYRFELQTSNQPGVWSAPVTLPFEILPPPWWRRSRLLMTISAGILLASVVLVSGLRMRQLLAIERLRTSLAAELHDHIGTGLTEIAIVSELGAHRKGGASPELAQVGETARQLVDRMNDIVWLVNPRRDSLHELVTRLKGAYAELFATAGVRFETGDLSSLEGVHLPMAYRENLHALLKEALHNALRHSRAGRVWFEVTLRGRDLEAAVRDDGSGFDPGRDGEGNGLGNMRLRAAALGGRLTVDSAGGRGTAVLFTGPVRRRRSLVFGRLSW